MSTYDLEGTRDLSREQGFFLTVTPVGLSVPAYGVRELLSVFLSPATLRKVRFPEVLELPERRGFTLGEVFYLQPQKVVALNPGFLLSFVSPALESRRRLLGVELPPLELLVG